MNRRNRDRDELNDEDDRPLKPKRKGVPTWLIVIIVTAPILMIGGCTGFVLMWRAAANRVTDGLQNPYESKRSSVIPREQFREKVMGKSKQEIIDMLGKPKRTTTIFGDELWYYEALSVDPISDRIDPEIYLDFGKGGVVERVKF